VDPVALARFLPDWQGVAAIGQSRPPLRSTAALERLAEVVDQLAGLPIPASVLERDVLPARVAGYQPRLLDELGALGEVAWVGRGSLGRDDGRIALVRPGREILRPPGAPDGSEPPSEPRHVAIREHLAARGASFYRELFAAARGTSDREVLDALWDLVWAGEVTNDTFAPLRALRWKRSGSGPRRAGGGRGRLTALGPPEAAGRWSLVTEPGRATATERLHAQSLALLDRHGVLTREAVATEGIEGGFAAVYPVLRAMEEAGRIRRGYFVDGLGAAQFALAGALDRLRAARDPADPRTAGAVHLLAAADPANPYGAALAWPRRGETDRRPLQRAAGAYVVLVDGIATLYLERGGSTIQTLRAADDPAVAVTSFLALRTLVADGRVRELVIRKVDGEEIGASPFRPLLLEAGFVAGYRGIVLRPPRTAA
jgi:ATP-dependent Lhr-like helicase